MMEMDGTIIGKCMKCKRDVSDNQERVFEYRIIFSKNGVRADTAHYHLGCVVIEG